DTGMMGGKEAHEYMYLTPMGEDTLMFCDSCNYSANRQVAVFAKPQPVAEELMPLEKVATPDVTSIADLTAFLAISPTKTAKAVFMTAELAEREQPLLIFAVLRGDMALNETKLTNALGSAGKGAVLNLRPALNEEIEKVGAVPGYASPIGIKRENVLVVADDLLEHSPNMVAGANEAGFHLRNTNLGCDYQADIIAEIAQAEDGAPCPQCGGRLEAKRGVEVGNIFKLGTRYTEALGATFLDEESEAHPIIMGSYGIGVGRLLGCVAEEYNNDMGLIWPVSIAPYPVHLVVLNSKDGSAEAAAEQLYADLVEAGLEPLYDDRDERAGVKFNDADLIGLPLRVTVSQRAMAQGGYEFKRRDQENRWIVPAAEALSVIRETLTELDQAQKDRFNL
ncbi:MAG: proline--tRNA ligase, partial [Anaerolineaceae bacterium]|nr:proline--tRNA ligase [Anaerolineaceae bacterium]